MRVVDHRNDVIRHLQEGEHFRKQYRGGDDDEDLDAGDGAALENAPYVPYLERAVDE
jgi:hypothetical protein